MTTQQTAHEGQAKIAIPVENGRLHNHLGGCRQFAMVHVDMQNKLALQTEIIAAPKHQPGLFPLWLREQGVKLVIAGGIGRRALAHFADYGIAVRAGVPGAGVGPLVAAYLSGRLTATPEGCNHNEYHRHHENADANDAER